MDENCQNEFKNDILVFIKFKPTMKYHAVKSM